MALLAWPLGAAAQTVGPEPRVVEVRFEPARPSFGEVFQLAVTLRIPPGQRVFLGDTLLPSDAVESVAGGRWRALPGPGDSVDIEGVYPVIGFREGPSNLPRIEAWLRPEDDPPATVAEVRRSLGELGSEPSARARRHLLPLGTVSFLALLPPGDSATEVSPRPPAGVLGPVWNGWLSAGAVLLVLLILAVGRWLRARSHLVELPGQAIGRGPPRREALDALDRLLAEPWLASGRTLDFYRTSTEVLRRFAHRVDPNRGPWLTSHELIRSLEGSEHPGVVSELAEAVSTAERVKFGDLRPTEDAAHRDWRAIRDWIEAQPD